MARASAEYRDVGAGDRLRHRARFYPRDAVQLRDLFDIVGRFDATEVLIDDRPVPYARELWLPLIWFHRCLRLTRPSAAVPRMAEHSDIQKDLQALAAGLKQLEAEYNMFFSGRLPRPPWETRNRVAALVKKWDRGYIQNTADRFGSTRCSARYQTFIDLWDRGLRSREGGPAPGPFATAAAAAEATKEQAPRQPKVVHVTAFQRSDARDATSSTTLYDSLMDARREAGDDVVPFHRFAALVQGQVTKLKPTAPEVAFRVAVIEGKVSVDGEGREGERRVSRGGREPPDGRGRRGGPATAPASQWLGGFRDVAGLRALGTIDDLELDRLSFLERPESGSLDRREVHEDVAAAVALNESVALGVVEPLDLACDTHRSFPALLMAAPRLSNNQTAPSAGRAQKKTALAALLVPASWTARDNTTRA